MLEFGNDCTGFVFDGVCLMVCRNYLMPPKRKKMVKKVGRSEYSLCRKIGTIGKKELLKTCFPKRSRRRLNYDVVMDICPNEDIMLFFQD